MPLILVFSIHNLELTFAWHHHYYYIFAIFVFPRISDGIWRICIKLISLEGNQAKHCINSVYYPCSLLDDMQHWWISYANVCHFAVQGSYWTVFRPWGDFVNHSTTIWMNPMVSSHPCSEWLCWLFVTLRDRLKTSGDRILMYKTWTVLRYIFILWWCFHTCDCEYMLFQKRYFECVSVSLSFVKIISTINLWRNETLNTSFYSAPFKDIICTLILGEHQVNCNMSLVHYGTCMQ